MRSAVVLLFLAGTSAIATAQPGATEPTPPPPPAPSFDEVLLERILDGVTLDDAVGVVRGTVDRARRATTFGPTVGGGVALFDGEVDAPVTVGLAVGTYKIPIGPSTELIKDVIRARVKARLIARINTGAGQAPPPEAELKQLALEIVDGVKAEIFGEMGIRARRLERPRLLVYLEGGHWPLAAGWHGRLSVLVGAGRTALGFTVGLQYDRSFEHSFGVLLGGELALPIQLSTGPRSHPLLLFVRGEAGTDGTDNLTFGARMMLDLI